MAQDSSYKLRNYARQARPQWSERQESNSRNTPMNTLHSLPSRESRIHFTCLASTNILDIEYLPEDSHVASATQSSRQCMLDLSGTHTPTFRRTDSQGLTYTNQIPLQSRPRAHQSPPLDYGEKAISNTMNVCFPYFHLAYLAVSVYRPLPLPRPFSAFVPEPKNPTCIARPFP